MTQSHVAHQSVIGYTVDHLALRAVGLPPNRQISMIALLAVFRGLTDVIWFHAVEEQPAAPPDNLREQLARGAISTLLVADDAVVHHGPHFLRTYYECERPVLVSVRQIMDAATPEGTLLRLISETTARAHTLALRARAGASTSFARPFLGGGVPYGYQLASPTGEANRFVIDEEAAAAVRQAFALRHEGMSLAMIAHRLNDAGYRTALGTLFTPKQVSRILQRERVYRGSTDATGAEMAVPPILIPQDPLTDDGADDMR